MSLTKVKASNISLTTAAASSNDTTPATTQYVTTAINNLIDGAPATLNTLDEIAAALNDDAALNTTLTNAIAAKLPLAGGTLTGDLVLKSDGGDDVINVVHSGNTVKLVSIGQSSDNSGNGVIQLKRNNGVLHTQIHSHGNTYFNGGNVGIGFASGSPDVKLDVRGEIAVGYDATYGLRFYNQGRSNWSSIGNFATDTTADLNFKTGGGLTMTMTHAKNVGIGTDNPGTKLDVDGSLQLRASGYTTYATRIYSRLDSTHCSVIESYLNNNTAFEMMGTYANSGGSSPRIAIGAGGQPVGIGRTDASYALDVSGSSNDGNPLVRGTATNTPGGGFNWATEFISPNLADDKRLTHIFGRQRTTHRMAHISYLPKTTASQSYLALGLWGANDILNVLGNGNVGINTVTPFTKFQVVHTAWSSGAPYGSLVHIDGGSNHDNNWGHLHVNQSGTSTNTGGRIRLGTSANNGFGGNPIAGITALNKDSSNGTYGNLEFSTRPSGGTNQMRMELSHNGHIKLSGDHGIRVFTGYFSAGTVSTNFDVSGYGAGVMMMTAAFNHYGFITSYGCYKRAICSNGPGHGGTAIEVNDVDSAITSANGGSWTFHRQSGNQSSYRITKNAGTYAGGGYYWVRFEGNMGA